MILAIDQGTTGTTCIVFDDRGQAAGRAYREFEQHFPRPGWVEHDAAEIWEVTVRVAREALEEAGVEVQSSEVAWLPKARVPVGGDDAAKVLRLVDALEDNDDVDAVHANFDIDAEVLERVAG